MVDAEGSKEPYELNPGLARQTPFERRSESASDEARRRFSKRSAAAELRGELWEGEWGH